MDIPRRSGQPRASPRERGPTRLDAPPSRTMLDLLAQSPALATVAAALNGLLVGSFLNVVNRRVPIMKERQLANPAEVLRGEPPRRPARLKPPVAAPRRPPSG